MSNFKNELEQEVEFINDLISRYLPDETGLDKKIREAMNYSVNAGGKRVRPMLMLECISCVEVMTVRLSIHLWQL